MNQNRSTMSLTNLGLNPDYTVRILFVIFLYVPNISLLVLLRLMFFHQHKSNSKVVDYFQHFCVQFKFGIFYSNFNISFIFLCSIFWFVAHSFSNPWSLSYIMICCVQMGDIRQPFDSSGGDLDPGAFLWCLDGREPMIHELWCHRIYGLCHNFNPTENIDIPAGTTGEFVTK